MNKKILLIVFMSLSSTAAFAQWKVTVEDNGFDEKSYVATVVSKDGNARITMANIEQGVVLGISTPDIVFLDRSNEVEVVFKIKGVNKTHKLLGHAGRGSSYIVLSRSDGNINSIDQLMLIGDFSEDFKNASLMKIKITYSVPYRGSSYESHEEYVFNMTGSTNAYNRVRNQK